jgi:hypothetical protein
MRNPLEGQVNVVAWRIGQILLKAEVYGCHVGRRMAQAVLNLFDSLIGSIRELRKRPS